MKRIWIILNILMLLVLTGCWNYREINEVQIVMGAAVDYDAKEDKYFMTVEVFNPLQEESAETSGLLYARGESIFDCFRNLIQSSGRRLYWGHAEVLIVSKEIAENTMLPILDVLFRDAEVRDDMLLFVSEEEDAQTILNVGRHKFDPLVTSHIENIMKSADSVSKYYRKPTWRFIKDLYAKGASPTLPLIKLVMAEESMVPKVGGTGVFKGDRLIGALNETETRGLLWVLDELKGGVFVVPVKKNEKKEDVTLEIFKSKTDRKVVYEDNEITMKIKVEMTVNIAEIGGTTNYMDEKEIMKLKKDGEELMEKEIENVIRKVQQKYKVDIFKFNTVIQENMPEVWREIELHWPEVFQNLNVEVQATLNIRGSALLSKPLKISE